MVPHTHAICCVSVPRHTWRGQRAVLSQLASATWRGCCAFGHWLPPPPEPQEALQIPLSLTSSQSPSADDLVS